MMGVGGSGITERPGCGVPRLVRALNGKFRRPSAR
jgi:hypothetical protein